MKTILILLSILVLMVIGSYWINSCIEDFKDQKYGTFGFDVMVAIFAILCMARAIFGTFV